MSVSSNLLCSFELLKPLDSVALKSHIKKGRNARNNMVNSPVSLTISFEDIDTNRYVACSTVRSKFLGPFQEEAYLRKHNVAGQ